MSCHMPNIGEKFKHVNIGLFYMVNQHLPSKYGLILLSLRKDNPVLTKGRGVITIDTSFQELKQHSLTKMLTFVNFFCHLCKKFVGPDMFLTERRMWTMMKQIQKNISNNKKTNAAERSSDASLSGFWRFSSDKIDTYILCDLKSTDFCIRNCLQLKFCAIFK